MEKLSSIAGSPKTFISVTFLAIMLVVIVLIFHLSSPVVFRINRLLRLVMVMNLFLVLNRLIRANDARSQRLDTLSQLIMGSRHNG